MPSLYLDQFEEEYDFPEYHGRSDAVVIAATPRCGSHMLGHSLFETGQFGFPLEYLNPANLAEWEKRLNTEGARDTLSALQRIRTSPNGIFGIKVMWKDVDRIGGVSLFHDLFSNVHYVFLERHSVLRQAVSWAFARQTGQYIASQPRTGTPSYDLDSIQSCLHDLLLQSAKWRYFLSVSDHPNMTVTYKHILGDLCGEIMRIGEFSGVEVEESCIPSSPPTSKQSSSEKEKWEDRFREEVSNMPLFDIVNDRTADNSFLGCLPRLFFD